MEVDEITELTNGNNIEILIPCIKNGLINDKSLLWLNCIQEMKWSIKTTLSDNYLWRCSWCVPSKSILHNSFLSYFQIPIIS